jgi:hypothetical protein
LLQATRPNCFPPPLILYSPRLVAALSLRRPGFDLRSLPVGFVVSRVALEQVFLRVLQYFPGQYHLTSAPYSYFIHPQSMLYNLTVGNVVKYKTCLYSHVYVQYQLLGIESLSQEITRLMESESCLVQESHPLEPLLNEMNLVHVSY